MKLITPKIDPPSSNYGIIVSRIYYFNNKEYTKLVVNINRFHIIRERISSKIRGMLV